MFFTSCCKLDILCCKLDILCDGLGLELASLFDFSSLSLVLTVLEVIFHIHISLLLARSLSGADLLSEDCETGLGVVKSTDNLLPCF